MPNPIPLAARSPGSSHPDPAALAARRADTQALITFLATPPPPSPPPPAAPPPPPPGSPPRNRLRHHASRARLLRAVRPPPPLLHWWRALRPRGGAAASASHHHDNPHYWPIGTTAAVTAGLRPDVPCSSTALTSHPPDPPSARSAPSFEDAGGDATALLREDTWRNGAETSSSSSSSDGNGNDGGNGGSGSGSGSGAAAPPPPIRIRPDLWRGSPRPGPLAVPSSRTASSALSQGSAVSVTTRPSTVSPGGMGTAKGAGTKREGIARRRIERTGRASFTMGEEEEDEGDEEDDDERANDADDEDEEDENYVGDEYENDERVMALRRGTSVDAACEERMERRLALTAVFTTVEHVPAPVARRSGRAGRPTYRSRGVQCSLDDEDAGMGRGVRRWPSAMGSAAAAAASISASTRNSDGWFEDSEDAEAEPAGLDDGEMDRMDGVEDGALEAAMARMEARWMAQLERLVAALLVKGSGAA